MVLSLIHISFREIAGMKVVKTADYQLSEAVDLATGQKTEIKLPKSNVLSYSLEAVSYTHLDVYKRQAPRRTC